MYVHNIFKFRSNIIYLFKTILPSAIANAGTRSFGKKIEQGLFTEHVICFIVICLKKNCKMHAGFWYLPSCFFPLLYVSSFLIQLNNNKYTFMKKTIFFFFLFDSKRRLLHKIPGEVKGVFSGKKINKQLP